MRPVVKEPEVISGNEQRRLVQTALRPRIIGDYLQNLFHLDTVNGRPPECRILDVKYEPGEYCTLLYQLGERMVIGTMTWGEADDDVPQTPHVIEQLGMHVYLFEHDPALPGLDVLRDSRALTNALNAGLPECQSGAFQVLHSRAAVLRYRPGRRCTFRMNAWMRDTATGERSKRTLFGKLYHEATKAEPAYREMQLLADADTLRDGRVVLARPSAYLPELLMVLQEPVGGVALDMLIGRMEGNATAGDPRGWDGMGQAAAALAAVHTAGLVAGRERPISAELKRFGKRATGIAEVDPALGAHLLDAVAALKATSVRLSEWGAELSLVHGDCKPNQFLIGAEGVAILDFDHCGMSDPANDVGTFLATLRQTGIRQALKARHSESASARSRWLGGLEAHFLDAYCAASERVQEFRLRTQWYEAAALVRKALRAFGRSPRSPMPLAQAEEAQRILQTLSDVSNGHSTQS